MKCKILLLLVLSVFYGVLGMAQDGREVKLFDDGWQFVKGPFSKDTLEFIRQKKGWKDVSIPHTWNAKDMQTRARDFYQGVAYYRKSFARPDIRGKRVFLRFEGVGQVAELYVNGKFAGNHKGGYSAFAFDITRLLKPGNNELILKVSNKSRPDVIPVNHKLFGVYGGIYRPVWMIITSDVNIAVTDDASPGVYISQKNVSAASADVEVKVQLVNKNNKHQPQPVTLEVAIYGKDGKLVTSKKSDIVVSPQGMQSYYLNFVIKNPCLWQGLKDPYLYKVVTLLKKKDAVIDNVTQRMGLRKIEAVAGKGIFLNGKKYPMYGVCRHQDWWGLGPALENKNHDADLALMMEMGVTTVRLAHYQQSDYFYSKCDSLGILVWAEIPFVNEVTTEEGANAKMQLMELVKQNYNHPSIYVWGLHNEVYKPLNYTARLTQDLHVLAKTLDPGRYTASVNGYPTMDHKVNLNADIQGINRYFGWYGPTRITDIKPWVEGLEKKFPHERLILSEYGAGANVNCQSEYIESMKKPKGGSFSETYQAKVHEIQWAIIKNHPYILASYVWNMFDFCVPNWNRGGIPARNHKGLVTFDRKIKKDAFYWYKANWSKNPVVYITQRRLKERKKQSIRIGVYSNLGEPTVTLNDVKLTGVEKGTTDVSYVFENVKLRKGVNTVKATVKKNGKVYSDEVEWSFTGE